LLQYTGQKAGIYGEALQRKGHLRCAKSYCAVGDLRTPLIFDGAGASALQVETLAVEAFRGSATSTRAYRFR
jgi:hypothetical protein